MDWELSVEHHIEVWEPQEAHNLGNQMPEKGMHTRSCYNFKTMKLKHDDDRKARIKELKSKTEGAGKGDKPRPITSKYWDNYDQINWKKK